MPILTIEVSNPDELLNPAYLDANAKGRVERSATGGGAGYAEIGTFTLDADTRVYTYYDLAGATSSWYRVRFSKADGSSPSSYGEEFQAGDELGGFICSVDDVANRVNNGTAFEDVELDVVLQLIRDVTLEIEQYCGRWFVPRPLSGTTTLLLHTRAGWRLRFPKGIHQLDSLAVATSGQPASGGTYTTVPAANWYLEPAETIGFPSTKIVLRRETGSRLYDASFGAQLVGGFGFEAVPENIRGIGVDAVIRRYLGKETAAPAVDLGPNGGTRILRDVSPSQRATLERYRDISGFVGRSGG